ncbi:hypothetical protein BE20_29385 [Sorangium cellulosum]|uniref:Tail sheath protein subtilisin-like domain-containing protein n=1 Tax=Sorangium cellulosum TaxID=56 RepID=A0A150S1N9_SORCE|nr:hypothetical protein BE18_16425 [Sorangium cellulosum]KYF86340.1 hypothetical protein BE20_29385 [Sorangium cellulosum]
MTSELRSIPGVPGAYRQIASRVPDLPRVRTDVAGFVGIGGPNRIGEAVRLDDWRSYELVYLRDERGAELPRPPGSQLADCVRAFFANGGLRCWVVNIAATVEVSRTGELLAEMLGLYGRTGLELLLLQPDVAIVALPDLHATAVVTDTARVPLPPLADQGAFVCCPSIRIVDDAVDLTSQVAGPLFNDAQMLGAQRHLLARVAREAWRVFALVTPPAGRTVSQAEAWRAALADGADPDELDCAALYWPWLQTIDRVGGPISVRPPLGYVAGIFARRDLAAGPHAAPANEAVIGAIGTEVRIDDRIDERLYAQAINPCRVFHGRGVQLWGARTLRWRSPASALDRPDALGFVNVRRCLSSIERSVERIGQMFMFEPNGAILRFGLVQAVAGYLITVHRAGALLGRTPTEAFFVRCDDSLNPPSAIAGGQVVCEIGVAIAAPAEFLVFRVGRRAGVIELQEGV